MYRSKAGDLVAWYHGPGGVPVDQHETAAVVEAHHVRGMEIAVAANHPLDWQYL
jgi:hypothetical protein